jgi:hypothetical protein
MAPDWPWTDRRSRTDALLLIALSPLHCLPGDTIPDPRARLTDAIAQVHWAFAGRGASAPSRTVVTFPSDVLEPTALALLLLM